MAALQEEGSGLGHGPCLRYHLPPHLLDGLRLLDGKLCLLLLPHHLCFSLLLSHLHVHHRAAYQNPIPNTPHTLSRLLASRHRALQCANIVFRSSHGTTREGGELGRNMAELLLVRHMWPTPNRPKKYPPHFVEHEHRSATFCYGIIPLTSAHLLIELGALGRPAVRGENYVLNAAQGSGFRHNLGWMCVRLWQGTSFEFHLLPFTLFFRLQLKQQNSINRHSDTLCANRSSGQLTHTSIAHLTWLQTTQNPVS